jgi:hypothetical protein
VKKSLQLLTDSLAVCHYYALARQINPFRRWADSGWIGCSVFKKAYSCFLTAVS